jgi:signal transduction histidine kinase
MEHGSGVGRDDPTIDGLGAWEGVRPTLWVRVGSGVAAVAYLGHLLACYLTWPVPIGDPIGEVLTFAACTFAFFIAPRMPRLGAAISCASVAAEVFVAAAIVPTEWVASLPVLPVVVLAAGLYFGARAALWAAAAAMVIYPLVFIIAGRIGPAVGGISPFELSRMVVFEGAVAGTGMMTWFALQALSRLHTEAAERRALEGRLREAQRLQVVGELAGVAVHDFRNILGVVYNAANLLTSSTDPLARQLATDLLQSARRGQEINTRLLSVARRSDARREVIDVAQAVEAIGPLATRLVGPRCIVSIDAEGPARAIADPGEMEQVVLNLAANARDAMGGGGRVSVRVRGLGKPEADRLGSTLAAARQVLVEVADHGTGIPPELQARIFEPFVTTKPRGEGTGLGLATVKSIAVGSGGAVTLESAPGAGAAFRIFLPEAVGALSPAAPPVPVR